MAKVIITCGKVCSGKTTYAKSLCKERQAILLSVDEAMLTIFGNDAGQMHDEYTERIKAYLKKSAADAVKRGIDVVMDWGLWTKQERSEIRAYFQEKGIEIEIHYLKIDCTEWKCRIGKRNEELIKNGGNEAYFVDEGLLNKCISRFEEPENEEIDVWINV